MMIKEEKRRMLEKETEMKEKEERRKKEEDQRKRQEEYQKAEEVRLKKESERRMAEEVKKKDEDKNRKRKEERNIREDEIKREKEEMKRLVEQEEIKNKEVKEEEEGEKMKLMKGCFMVTGKMRMMDREERKKLKNELKAMKERDHEAKKMEKDLRFSSLFKIRANQEDVRKEEERDEVQLGSKRLENEVEHKEDEEKRETDKGKILPLEMECIIRQRAEKRGDKEMEGSERGTHEEEQEQRNTKEESRYKKENKESKEHERENIERGDLEKANNEDKRQEELEDLEEKDDNQIKKYGTKGVGVSMLKAEKEQDIRTVEDRGCIEGKTGAEEEGQPVDCDNLEENEGENQSFDSLQMSPRTGHWAFLMSDPFIREATTNQPINLSGLEPPQQRCPDRNISDTSEFGMVDQLDSKHSTSTCSLPASLHDSTEQKRLLWMRNCVPWSKLSLQNKRKQQGSFQSQRRPRRAAGGSSLSPLCPHSLLESTGRKSLQEVTVMQISHFFQVRSVI